MLSLPSLRLRMLNKNDLSHTGEQVHSGFQFKPFVALLSTLCLSTLDNIVPPLPPPGRGALDEPFLDIPLPALGPVLSLATRDSLAAAAPSPRPAPKAEPRLAAQGVAQGVKADGGLGGAGGGLVADGAQGLDGGGGGLGDGLDGADEAELGAEGGE